MVKQRDYTMRDVARLAGVSVSTVSAVVNNKGTVGPELSAAVQKAIAALGFSPHEGARGLRTGRSHMLGLVVPDITNPFFVETLRGFEDEAIKIDYEVVVCNSNDQAGIEARHLEALRLKRIDGVLLAPTDSYAARERLGKENMPLAFIDCIPMKANVNCVVTDNFECCYNAIRYLVELGHRKVAVIAGDMIHSTSIDRVEGCRKAMQEANLALLEETLMQGDSHIESGYRIGMNILQAANPPTAIFTLNNRMALGVLRAMNALKVPCPERVSIMSFDDADWAEAITPSLTSIAQPTYEMGKAGAKLLLGLIQASAERFARAPTDFLKSTLHIRKATGPVPAQ